MKTLIESHKLKNMVVNYQDSSIITGMLKYQNQTLRSCVSENGEVIIVALPQYDNKVIDENDSVINYCSSGAVILLNKEQDSDKYKLVCTILSKANKGFESFGNYVELSQNGKYIIITNKLNQIFIYNNEGALLQLIDLTNVDGEVVANQTLGENILLSKNNEQLLISDSEYSYNGIINAGRVLLYEYDRQDKKFKLSHTFMSTTPTYLDYFGSVITTNYNTNNSNKLNNFTIMGSKSSEHRYSLKDDIWMLN